jgi:hypothetical protein
VIGLGREKRCELSWSRFGWIKATMLRGPSKARLQDSRGLPYG